MANPHTSKAQHPKLQDFFIQAEESLTDFEENLIKLEALARPDADTLARLFTTLNTFRTEATTLALNELADCTRRGEDTLAQVRSGALEVSTTLMNSLFQTGDALKDLLHRYQQGDMPAAAPVEQPAAPAPVLSVVKPVAAVKPTPVKTTAPEVKTPTARAFYKNNHLVVEVSGLDQPLGTAEVEAQGDTLTIQLPLASANIQAIIAGAGEQTFAVPMQYVLEVGKLTADAATDTVLAHQGETLPLKTLHQEGQGSYFIILQQGSQKLALAVNTLIGQAEVNPTDTTHTLLDVPQLFRG